MYSDHLEEMTRVPSTTSVGDDESSKVSCFVLASQLPNGSILVMVPNFFLLQAKMVLKG